MINKTRNLVEELQCELVGKIVKRSFIIKINSENLTTNGEISFPVNLLAWRGLISFDDDASKLRNILEYYLRRKKYETDGLSLQEIANKASESLIAASKEWPTPLTKFLLKNERICLFLNRQEVISSTIKEAVRLDANFGEKRTTGKSIYLKVVEDKDSELTSERLKIVGTVTEAILRIQGFEVVRENADALYLLTTKSEGPLEENYQRCVCGVVKNQQSNTKETSLTWALYINEKIRELESLTETKFSEISENLEKIAHAVVTFELLAVKPSRPVFVKYSGDADTNVSSSKGGSFVLYNTARMSAILERFKEEVSAGNYPNLPDINNVDFQHLTQEEEWELVYNFVLGYPEMIDNCVSIEGGALETCPQTLCLFLSRLSQRFSVYYRRVRILTKGRDHLVPTMMARLYLLSALQVVVNNCLTILNIVPVRHM